METKMTWGEMKEKFPNEWLMVVNFTVDQYGEIKEGEVVRHSENKEEVYQPVSDVYKDVIFSYTGESAFNIGFRYHANHHCF